MLPSMGKGVNHLVGDKMHFSVAVEVSLASIVQSYINHYKKTPEVHSNNYSKLCSEKLSRSQFMARYIIRKRY